MAHPDRPRKAVTSSQKTKLSPMYGSPTGPYSSVLPSQSITTNPSLFTYSKLLSPAFPTTTTIDSPYPTGTVRSGSPLGDWPPGRPCEVFPCSYVVSIAVTMICPSKSLAYTSTCVILPRSHPSSKYAPPVPPYNPPIGPHSSGLC